jgi:hypothetical protein
LVCGVGVGVGAVGDGFAVLLSPLFLRMRIHDLENSTAKNI